MPNKRAAQTKAPPCCQPDDTDRKSGWWRGLLYGLAPHTFCILFVVFSVIGATVATSVIQQLLVVPYLFQLMVALSLVAATLSAVFYLRRNGLLSWAGVRRKRGYLATMYGATLVINLLFFLVVFPAVANLDLSPTVSAGSPSVSVGDSKLTAPQSLVLAVKIPCSGHAPLIMSALKSTPGVLAARYEAPDRFAVTYDPLLVTISDILAQEVFQSFPAKLVN